jgi:hypothetical protein
MLVMYNYNDVASRNFAQAAKHSSSEYDKYLINSDGGLCSENPIGSKSRMIDSEKTSKSLQANSVLKDLRLRRHQCLIKQPRLAN